MTTPKKSEIREKALELYVEHCYRSQTPELANITPTEQELKEAGFYSEAATELMRDPHRSEVESRDYLPDFPSKLDFNIDEGLRTGFYVSGTTGTGKSDVSMYISDMLMKKGVPVFVFDPSQDWIQRSSIPYCVTVCATKPLDVKLNGCSTIFDISRLTIPQQKRLVEWFCKTIFEHQVSIPSGRRQAYYIMFEEAHTYFPQGCMRAKAYENSVRLLTQGRNYKVRMGIVTQFSSLVDKNAMRYMRQRYFGCTDEKNDVEYLRTFLDSHSEQLKKLPNGQFLYYHAGKISRIAIEPYQNNILKTEPKIPVKPKQLQTENIKVLATLLTLLGLAFAIGVWIG